MFKSFGPRFCTALFAGVVITGGLAAQQADAPNPANKSTPQAQSPDVDPLKRPLTDKQRNELKKNLQQRKRDLQAAIKAIDRGLGALAKTPKRK